MIEITVHAVKHPRRGYPMYPTNGLMPTKFMVKIDGLSGWRRVYERWDKSLPSGSRLYEGQPVPLIKIEDDRVDLTPEQRELIGWKLKGDNR